MKIKLLSSLAILLSFQVQVRSSTFTNLVTFGSNEVASLVVRSGQLAKVISANYAGGGANGYIWITANGTAFSYGSAFRYTFPEATAAIVAGPATGSLNSGNCTNCPMFCTVELVNPSEAFTPSNAVVIPADSGGPVKIILESSTDLITWTPAIPGTYGTSTEKRFFRVRAERTQ